jgi:hypothetical protein
MAVAQLMLYSDSGENPKLIVGLPDATNRPTPQIDK